LEKEQTFGNNGDVRDELDLLCDLKKFLPVKLKSIKPFVKDEVTMPGVEHIAIEFGLEQTKELIEFIRVIVSSRGLTPVTGKHFFKGHSKGNEVFSSLLCVFI